MGKKQGKDLSIESLRGLAVILLVAAHVIGSNSSKGIHVPDNSFLRYLYFFFLFIRMPLFTVISGYVYAMRPIAKGQIANFYLGKLRRIFLPMLVVATIQFICMSFIPGVNKQTQIGDFYKIYYTPFDQFWFLQALIIIFIIIGFLEIFCDLKSIQIWMIIMLLVGIVFLFLPVSNFFSFNSALYLLPFFILGIGFNRYQKIIFTKFSRNFFGVLLIVGLIIQNLFWFDLIDISIIKRSPISLFVGVCSVVSLFYFKRNITLLAKLGYFSYSIYLYHILGTAGMRIFLTKVLCISNYKIIFIPVFLSGVLFPIIVEKIAIKSQISGLLFLGQKIK